VAGSLAGLSSARAQEGDVEAGSAAYEENCSTCHGEKLRATGAAPVQQADVDAYVARQVKFDPDLWVLEFETPDLLPPFEAKIL